MAIEKPTIVRARHDANDIDIENLKRIKEDLRNETRDTVREIEVQQRYAARLKYAAEEIYGGHGL